MKRSKMLQQGLDRFDALDESSLSDLQKMSPIYIIHHLFYQTSFNTCDRKMLIYKTMQPNTSNLGSRFGVNVRMRNKIKSVLNELTDLTNRMEEKFNSGIVDGFTAQSLSQQSKGHLKNQESYSTITQWNPFTFSYHCFPKV